MVQIRRNIRIKIEKSIFLSVYGKLIFILALYADNMSFKACLTLEPCTTALEEINVSKPTVKIFPFTRVRLFKARADLTKVHTNESHFQTTTSSCRSEGNNVL